MKKKFISGLAMIAALSTTPVTLTSCSEDDINTVLYILDLFTSGDELSNTAWITDANDFAIEFASNGTGNMYFSSDPIAFSYVLDKENNKLTLTYSDNSSEVLTVLAFTANTSLKLQRANGKTYTLKPFTDTES